MSQTNLSNLPKFECAGRRIPIFNDNLLQQGTILFLKLAIQAAQVDRGSQHHGENDKGRGAAILQGNGHHPKNGDSHR